MKLDRLPLKTARSFAEKIVAEIAPYCERLEIAGSIRRERATVGDVDLVCLARDRDAIMRRVLSSSPVVIKNGAVEFVAVFGGKMQLDLWFAAPPAATLFETKPGNFGSLLLCRTGSAAHNIYLVERAKSRGLRWNPHWGIFDREGKCLASETEEEIFRALDLELIPPPRRER